MRGPASWWSADPDPPPDPRRCQRLADVGERKNANGTHNTHSILPVAPRNQDHPAIEPRRVR